MNKKTFKRNIIKTSDQMVFKLQSLELTTLQSPSNKDSLSLINKIKEEGYNSKYCTIYTWDQYFNINKTLKYKELSLTKTLLMDYRFEYNGKTVSNQILDYIKEFLPNRPKEFFNKEDWLELNFQTINLKESNYIIKVNNFLNKLNKEGKENINLNELKELYNQYKKDSFNPYYNYKHFFYNKKENLIITFNHLSYKVINDKDYKGPNDLEAGYSYIDLTTSSVY